MKSHRHENACPPTDPELPPELFQVLALFSCLSFVDNDENALIFDDLAHLIADLNGMT
jgi:hypothetical protein